MHFLSCLCIVLSTLWLAGMGEVFPREALIQVVFLDDYYKIIKGSCMLQQRTRMLLFQCSWFTKKTSLGFKSLLKLHC